MVTVLTVTYSDRWPLLKRVLDKLQLIEEVNEIIIVDNNSSQSDVIRSWILNSLKSVEHIVLDKNYGSAKAFGDGLKYFVRHSKNKFIWLLDDDNLPDDKALRFLLDAYDRNEKKGLPFALTSLRVNRPYLVKAAQGIDSQFLFPTVNSFIGFSWGVTINKIFKGVAPEGNMRNVKIPMCPYGGLFLSKDVISAIGYPLDELFLYVDDFEYTFRITSKGGFILLVVNSIVSDIDVSWVANKKKFLKPRVLFQDDFRSQYSIRNSVFFGQTILRNSNIFYLINKTTFNFYLFISAIVHLRPRLFIRYLTFVREGNRLSKTLTHSHK